MTRATDIAYAAGLIDGEAYIGIKRTEKARNGRVNPGFYERIQVRMVDKQAIAFLARLFGGNFQRQSANAAHGKPLYCYSASCQIAVNILAEVRPFLKVKRAVADTVLQFHRQRERKSWFVAKVEIANRWGTKTVVRRRRHSAAYLERCERAYRKCKAINQA